MLINPLDLTLLRRQFASSKPFPYVVVDDFLEPSFAREVADAYPTFEQISQMGFAFNAVNERKKVQVTDSALFAEPVRRLSDAIDSPAFLADLSYITGIPNLLADEQHNGGGMHMTGPGGRLDVHIDFNVISDRKIYRRLNLLLYLNPDWDERLGGEVELWDRDVRKCVARYPPTLNRCLIFQTSDISFHGVAPLRCPPNQARRSFAAYYYTKEHPEGFRGIAHSTVFRARPDEPVRRYVLMPAEKLEREARSRLIGGMRKVKRLLARAALLS
jgi:Rps23 Pro-64 3,4-dihydroxylase Tpa1-like proline 4-hydroxylase